MIVILCLLASCIGAIYFANVFDFGQISVLYVLMTLLIIVSFIKEDRNERK